LNKKIYTAFISSAFNTLRNERKKVIDVLLDFRIMPIGMEHFTVTTNGEFSDIEDLIDDSDFLIMLMGAEYGSCDENGISWTEREYIYATNKHKPTVVIICDELKAIKDMDKSLLSDTQKKQVEFANKITFGARTVSEEFNIRTILSQFLNTYDFSKCIGWTRIEKEGINSKELETWRENNKVFNLAGNWHHVHLSEDDESYIRVGTAHIEQEFFPDRYSNLHIDGVNYSVDFYDTQRQMFIENKMKSSRFVGEYTLKENGEIFGIFNSKRTFSGTFNSLGVSKGTHRGIHDFKIDIFSDVTERIDGEFHDEAPSPKLGRIFLFRKLEERDAFLLSNRGDVLKKK